VRSEGQVCRLPTVRWRDDGRPQVPFTGTQVDTIDWAREQIVKTGIALEKARTQLQEVVQQDLIRHVSGNLLVKVDECRVQWRIRLALSSGLIDVFL
jgi:hypothetical protein